MFTYFITCAAFFIVGTVFGIFVINKSVDESSYEKGKLEGINLGYRKAMSMILFNKTV